MIGNQQDNRAVTPVVATVLLVAVLVILAGTLAASFFGYTEKSVGPRAKQPLSTPNHLSASK